MSSIYYEIFIDSQIFIDLMNKIASKQNATILISSLSNFHKFFFIYPSSCKMFCDSPYLFEYNFREVMRDRELRDSPFLFARFKDIYFKMSEDSFKKLMFYYYCLKFLDRRVKTLDISYYFQKHFDNISFEIEELPDTFDDLEISSEDY